MNTHKFVTVWKGEVYSFEGERSSVFIKAEQFMKNNNIFYTKEDLFKQIDRQSKVGGSFAPSKKGKKVNTISFKDAINAVGSVVKNLMGQAPTDKEILRRADICSRCPLLQKASGCGPCGFLKKITDYTNNIRKHKKITVDIPMSVRSHYCGFCGCALSNLIAAKTVDMYPENEEKNLTRPDVCWLKKTSPNFTHE